jgi:hypothetical protein
VNGTYQVNGQTFGFSLNRPLFYKSGMTATHSQVTQLILQKANSLPDTDKSTQNQIMLKFVSGLPLVSKAGIAPNNALVWILFSDTGRNLCRGPWRRTESANRLLQAHCAQSRFSFISRCISRYRTSYQ